MPLYEYECKQCDQVVELLVRSPQEQPQCPQCGQLDLTRVLSVTASPAMREGGGLPVSRGENCGAPRCCGGGCQL